MDPEQNNSELDLDAIVQEFSSKPKAANPGPEPDLIAVNPSRPQSAPTAEEPAPVFAPKKERSRPARQPRAEAPSESQPPVRRQRHKKTKGEVFRETYLPVLWIIGAILGIICIIVGITNLRSNPETPQVPMIPADTQNHNGEPASGDAADVLASAQVLASHYDYAGALDLLNRYTGNTADVTGWNEAISTFTSAQEALVAWTDVSAVPHISFQPLIADTSLAWDGDGKSGSFASNNLSTSEFSAILQQLYEGGYVLVSLHDLIVEEGNTMTAGEILLPEDKKPLIISQVPTHYDDSMEGNGFATRLVIGTDGKPTCEMINSSGATVTGDYDLVPILGAFVEAHPDFSYHGAKAILAVNGEDGIFGYATGADDAESDPGAYAAAVENASKVAQCLLEDGYEFASFTYATVAYGSADTTTVTDDSDTWVENVLPILGECDILIFPQGTDLTTKDKDYSGSKFRSLYNDGFRYFISMDNDRESWGSLNDKYFRQARRTVNGKRVTGSADSFTDLFDATAIVSPDRP